jgi:HEAT repeat protein
LRRISKVLENSKAKCKFMSNYDEKIEKVLYQIGNLGGGAVMRENFRERFIDDPDAFQALIKIVQNKGSSMRTWAVVALESLKDPKAVFPLSKILSEKQDALLDDTIIYALGEIGDRRAIPVLNEMILQGRWVRKAVEALLKLPPSETSVYPLERALNESEENGCYKEVVIALKSINNQKVVEILLSYVESYKLIDAEDKTDASLYSFILQQRKLCDLRVNSDFWSPRVAIAALFEITEEYAITPFLQATKSQHRYVRVLGALLLSKFGTKKAFDGMVELLDDQDPIVVIAGIQALAAQRNPEAVPQIIEMLKKDSKQIKKAVAGSLKILTNHSFLFGNQNYEKWYTWLIGNRKVNLKKD